MVERRQLGIGDDDADVARAVCQFFGDDLSEARAGAAADIGGADKQFDLAIGVDAHARIGRRRRSGRRLVQQRDAKAMIRRRAFLPALELITDFQQTLAQRDMVGAIAGRSYVAGIKAIFQPKRDRIDAELLRNDIHLRFAGPHRFGYAEAAKRAAAQFVGID